MFHEGDRVYLNHVPGGALQVLLPATITEVTPPRSSVYAYIVRKDDGETTYAMSHWVVDRNYSIDEAI